MSGDPFAEGREAFDCGKSETDNPYPDDSVEFMSWNDGYNAAAEDEFQDDSAPPTQAQKAAK